MLPVWMTTYTYGEKDYLVLINGENGIVQGELPINAKPKSNGGIMGWFNDLIDS